MKQNCDLTIPEYWEKYKWSIASARNWDTEKDGSGVLSCQTLGGYDRQMQRIKPYLRMSICDTTFFDLQKALEKVQQSRKGGRTYSSSTMAGYRSMLSDILRYAQDRGDAYNVLAYFLARGKTVLSQTNKTIAEVIDPALPKAVMMGRLRAELEKRIYLPRSLQPEQQAHLIRLILERVEEDGRYCGIAIMLYAGLRPSECRALRWMDVCPFADHPERHVLCVQDSLNRKGKRKGRTKTKNGFRKVPVHIELEQILQRRKHFIEETLRAAGKDTNIESFPICCMENEYGKVCRDYQLSILASEVLNRLSITTEALSTYLLDMIADQGEKAGESSDLHLASYVLRRNFWTWLQSSTQMTEMEKRYVMGHKMLIDNVDIRPRYNAPERLWNICRKMDRHAISLILHHKNIKLQMHLGQEVSLGNCGIIRVKIPKEQLTSGGTLNIQAITNECGDKVIVKALSPVKPFGNITATGKVVDCMPAEETPTGINCEYDNYQVLERLRSKVGKKSSMK